MPSCPRRARFNHTALICAFNAHVRSVIEYGSVIWSGAAVTHLARLERLRHRFFMWLGSTAVHQCPSMHYEHILAHFKMVSIRARLTRIDVLFVHSVFTHRQDCVPLTSFFSLAAPTRRSRHTGLFHEPFGRVNTVKNGFISRIPGICNRFLHENPSVDFFHPSKSFRSDLDKFANGQGTYL